MDFEKFKKAYQRRENAEKSTAQKALEKMGSQFDKDGNLIKELYTQDGKYFGNISYNAYKAIEGNTLDSYKPKNEEEKSIISNFRNHTGIAMKSADGKEIGKVSYDGYTAILNNNLDGYTPKNDNEKNVIETIKKEPILPFVIEIDNEKKDFGKISYNAYKAVENGTVENYKPVNDSEKKAINDYIKFAEEYAKKQREPENLGQGLLHGVGYTLEKLGAGATDFVADMGNYVLAGGATVLRPFTWGTWNKGLQNFASTQLNSATLGDMWSESAESRYRVPDWYREYGGTTAQGVGSLAVPMLVEYATMGLAPTEGYTATQLAKMASTASNVSKASLATKLATKLAKPKTSEIIFGLGATSSATKEAYQQSGNLGKAYSYGILNGLGEMATERLFGGFAGTNIGPDELIDVQKLVSKIPKIGKLASTKVGAKVLDIAFEGVEEGIMALADPAMQKMTFNSGEKLSDLYKNIGLGESALQGILLSSVMNASTYTLSKGINVANKTKAINTLNKSAKKLNATLPNDATKFEPLKLTATIGQINERNSELARIDAINNVNVAIDGINALFKDEADKIEPLKYNATIDEIQQRQKEIQVFGTGYADLMVEELIKNNPEKFENIVDTPTEQTTVTETPMVAENATVEQTTPVEVEQRNTFTEELDEIASTEMPTVSVGETFVDNSTGRTVKVVNRDDATTTVEITTPDGKTETRQLSNKTADTLAVDDKYSKVETTAETPAENVAVAENAIPTEAVTPQAEMPRVNVGDVYEAGGKTYTITGRENGRTTYTITDGSGKVITREISNVTADINFTKEDAFTKVQDGNTSTTEAENVPTAVESVSNNNELPEAFKRGENGKIYFNQANIDYGNNTMRKGQFEISKSMTSNATSETVDGWLCGKYGIHKDKTGKQCVVLLQSGLKVAALETLTEAKAVAVYLNENLSFNDVTYKRGISGDFYFDNISEVKQYGNDIKDILNNKKYETHTATEIENGKVPFHTKAELINYVKSHIGDKVNVSFNNGTSDIRLLEGISNTNLKTKYSADGMVSNAELKGLKFNDTGFSIDFKNGVEVTYDFVNISDKEVQETKPVKTETVEETKMDADDVYTVMDELGLTAEQQGAIMKYKSGESYTLNCLLRDGKALADHQQNIKDGLTEALKKFPVYKGRVYRHIGFMKKDAFNDFIVEHANKTTITYSAFTSASKTIDGYVVEAPYLVYYEIESVDGRDVSQIGIKSEKEILFATDTTFEILSIEKNENSLTIKMKEVNQNGKGKSEGTLGERGKQQSSEGNASKSEYRRTDEEVHSTPNVVRGRSATNDEIYKNSSESNSGRVDESSGTDNTSSIGKTGDVSGRERTLSGIEKKAEDGAENVESQSEVLAGESGNDGGGLRSKSSKSSEQETIERVDGQSGENSGETLPQSTGTDGNRPDVGNDSEGVHRGNDTDISESETTGNVEKTAEETPETIETEDKSIEKKRPSNKENFVITNDIAREFDNTLPSAEDNIKAIELLLTLENEGRPATAEEKKILAKYKGWGGIDIRRLPWELSRKLYDLYDGQQLREMQSSQNNAFFTPTGVIDAMYNGLKRMGFKGGNVLESSMGIGNFFGRMPVAMTGKSYLTGVELESYTARIAQYLYPAATVINKPFQDVAIRNGSYDLVIGNVPFGTNKITYNKKKYSLHNYFIISSLDKVKDGGVVAVITSSGTLDSYGIDARKAIMDRADVVACYKLPEKVFSRNANTDTTTDLLILKKRASDAKPSGDSILNVTTTADGLRLNEYFVKHPENVLGVLAKGSNAWGEITTVLDNGGFYDKLNDAMNKLPKDLISGKTELKPIETIVSTSSKPRFFEKNGKVYADDGAGTATAISKTQEKTVRDYMAVRDAYKDLLSAYENDMSETDIKPLRDKLTTAYDNFYKKHTAITGDGKKKMGNTKSTNNTFLEADSDYYLVSGLERYDAKEGKFVKSALFEKDTLRKKKVTSVDTSSDALAISLNETGRIDFARMSDLTGKTEKQLAEELKGEIVLTPEGDYVLTDIYLSGNIYEKLEAVKDKPEFKEQKEMLEKVLPTPKDASTIMVKLGANYIDTKYVQDFSREVFHERIEVSKDSTGRWSIEGSKRSRYGDILNVKYGCDAFNAIQLLEKILNDGEITAKKTIKVDGKSVSVFDEKMTEVARQKAEDIKEAFENWIFRDSERRAVIVDKYNRTYNNYRPLDYEHIADKLSFDSMDETLKAKLYPHQKKGIARFLFGGNILFAHGVGTGKTFEMIASVMEAKRMGIINKAAMVVPNNKVVDFKNDIAQAYPNAKVLVVDTANKKRQTMLGLVNSNDWDIVLIARTTFTKIPVGPELQANYINQQLEELDRQIVEAENDRNISKRKLKGLYTQRDNLEQKLKDLDSETKRDENSVDFEKLGFDCICVDEAHNYKSITTLTKLDIKGLANDSNSQQANDMLMKLDYMRSIDGRIIFGTGTPITNTVSEIYNMMRMVRPDILEDAGIHSLDEWVNTFAKIDTHTEIGIDNKIKNKSTQTIRSFVNGTEMVGMFRQFADVVFTQDVVKNLPKAIPVQVELEGTEELRQIESEISSAIASASGAETLKIYTQVMAMANAASIDLKMLSGAESDVNIFKDYSLEELEYENSKINTMCNYVYDEYKASNGIKGTQIIFCDGGAGSGTVYSFNVHNDIVKKLIERGIPEKEIVIVKNQKDAQLEELFDKVNSGEVRVLIGTSRKMAEGLNVQKRVVAIHHPTVTFKPSDLEQGDARGVRAGNINEEVKIYRYLQGNTFDSYKWQAIDRKGEMINKALRGEAVDELEDIGADDESGAGVDAATAMAITSGNPLVKEKIDIDKEVKRLKTLKQNFMNEYYRYADAVAKNPSQIRQLTEYAQRIEQDIALRNKQGDKAKITIKDKTFEKQTDANKALIEAVKTAPKNGQFTKIGEHNGFDIMFKGDTGGLNYALVVKGANEYSVEYAGNGNNVARIDGVLKRLDAELTRVQNKVEQLKSDLEFAKQEVNKPFEKEKDLTEALEKQKDITYRYEHFGESKSAEQTETAETENSETVHYSKQSVVNTSDTENKWTTERVNPVKDNKKSKEKSVSIADIVNSIREKFDIPVATGKVTIPEASGLYKEKAESIRTRIANNLPTISHELGHHLDKKYGLSKLDSVKKLRKAVSEEFLNQYPATEKDAEAVAEFVRQYLKNTNEANRLCPEFYNDFVRALSSEDLKAVNEIANTVNEYMSYDFSGRVRASIVSGDVKEKTSLSEKAKKAHADWIDGFIPIKDVVEYVEETTGTSLSGRQNAYTLATNSLNARAIANFNTVHGFRDLNGNIIDGAKSYIECIANIDKKDLNTLDEYLVLKHSLEWIAPKHEDATVKRVFADDTLEDVESIEKRIAMIESNFPQMKEAADNLYEYQRNILKHIVIPAGGMTEDTFNSLNEKYPCYVPFYRAIGKDGAKTKGSFANQKSPIKRAKGSGELILSPLESIIKNTDKMVKFALRNQTMQVLASYADTVDGFGKFMEKVPPDMLPHTTDITFLKDKFEDALQRAVSSGEDYFAVSGLFDEIFGNAVTDFTPIANSNKKIVTVLGNGTFSYYQIHDEGLYDAVAEFTPKNLKGIFALSHKLMQPMKLLITQSNPVFGTTNFFRDIGTAYKHSRINNPAEFAIKYVLAAKEVITKGDVYKQWQAMGGGHNSELSASLDQIKVTLRQVAQKDMGKARRLLYSIICHPIATTAALNDYIESTPRLMEFMRTLESGGDLQEAIYNADDITTNFKRSGKGSFAKDMNALVMFNNAALQGLDKTARTLTNKNKAERNKTLLKWALSALLMAVIQAFWNKANDDEGYENLSSYVKNNFYNFSIGDGKFISIPKARETALLDSFTERTIEYVFGNDDAFYEFGAYVSEQILPPMIPNSLNPVDAAHDVLGSTVIGGLADVGWNKNYMDVPIEGKYDEYSPSNERYNEKTSAVAYALGQTKLARMADMSPKKIDHLISSYTGIMGQANKALFPMNKENRDATIGLRNKFLKDSNYSTDLLNKAYDNKDKAELKWQYDNSINNAIEYEQNAIITSFISGMNKAIKALPEEEQREGRKYLLKTLNEWDYNLSTSQQDMISRLENESISNDYIFEELPSSEISWTQNKQKYTYQMTPQEYNDYINKYLTAIDTARKKSNGNYTKAKESAKDVMSRYKKRLTSQYRSKATKVE